MSRVMPLSTGLTVLAVLAVALGWASADDKTPSIKDIMTKAHKGGDSLIEKLGKELKADEPKWDDVQKETKELVDLGSALGKNDPPKGEKESWAKLTKQYVDEAKVLDGAAQKKDKAAAAEAQKTLKTYCAACHKEHKK
jgi:cytochrome c553